MLHPGSVPPSGLGVQGGGMVIRIPTPGATLSVARSAAGWALDTVTAAASVPARVLGLLDGVEELLRRVRSVVDRADELIERTSRTVEDVQGVLEEARTVAGDAAQVVNEAARVSTSAEKIVSRAGAVSDDASRAVVEAQRTAATADELLRMFEPTARRAAPMAERFVDELSPEEVDAAIRVVDQLPVLTEHLLSDVLPILRTLDRVGPEIHELLEVSHDVRRAILGIPGFGFFRRRGEGRISDQDVAPRDGQERTERDRG